MTGSPAVRLGLRVSEEEPAADVYETVMMPLSASVILATFVVALGAVQPEVADENVPLVWNVSATATLAEEAKLSPSDTRARIV